MYNGPQVSHEMRKNASLANYLEEGSRYRCPCGHIVNTKERMQKHGRNCEVYQETEKEMRRRIKKAKRRNKLQNGKIMCQICEECFAHVLTWHIRNEHDCTKKKYKEKYNSPVVSEDAKENYSEQNKINGDWIRRAKESGKDLSSFKEKLSEAVSEAIMNDPEERERRSNMLAKLNKREDFRRRASRTAKKTSARTEIQKRRAKQLREWRNENPEEFWEKCVSSLHNSYESNPERRLYELVDKAFPACNFERNCQLQDEVFSMNKTNRKQIDILSKKENIIIEFDGPMHFRDYYDHLKEIQRKDVALNKYAVKNNFNLIRVSTSNYDYKNGDGDFHEKALLLTFSSVERSKEMSEKGAIILIGEEYGKNSIL